jgi:hypothetical protein
MQARLTSLGQPWIEKTETHRQSKRCVIQIDLVSTFTSEPSAAGSLLLRASRARPALRQAARMAGEEEPRPPPPPGCYSASAGFTKRKTMGEWTKGIRFRGKRSLVSFIFYKSAPHAREPTSIAQWCGTLSLLFFYFSNIFCVYYFFISLGYFFSEVQLV